MERITLDTCPESKKISNGGKKLYYCNKESITFREGALKCKYCLQLKNFFLKYNTLLGGEANHLFPQPKPTEIISSLKGAQPPKLGHCSSISVGRNEELNQAQEIIETKNGSIMYVEGEFREGKSFFARLLGESYLVNENNKWVVSFISLEDNTDINFLNYINIIKRLIQHLYVPSYPGRHKYFSNGLDALFCRYLLSYTENNLLKYNSGILDPIEDILINIQKILKEETRFYSMHERKIKPFIESMLHSEGEYTVFSEYFSEDNISSERTAIDLLILINYLVQELNYNFLIVIDELEKTNWKNYDHYNRIYTFISYFKNIHFVFTGNHNLLFKGEESIENLHKELYKVFYKNRIILQKLYSEDYIELYQRIRNNLPKTSINKINYSGGIENFVNENLKKTTTHSMGTFLLEIFKR